MESLGPSLFKLKEHCGGTLSLKSTLMVGIQLLRALRCIHEAGFVHRDLKPQNVTIGLGSNSTKMYLIDFGLAKRYRDYESRIHIARENTQ